jgi:hypothetical protein
VPACTRASSMICIQAACSKIRAQRVVELDGAGTYAMVGGRRNSGSEIPPLLRTSRSSVAALVAGPNLNSIMICSIPAHLQFRRQKGSHDTPITFPTNSPKKVSPVCHRLKPWLWPKTSGKA